MTKKRNLIASAIGLGLLAASSVAMASSHREAPSISNDPAADNTDLYAWVNKGTHDKMQVVLCYNPLEEPSGGPNFHQFSDDVLYELHLTRGATSLNDAVRYQFQFKSRPFPRVDPADLKLQPGGGKEFFIQLSGFAQTMTVTKISANGSASVIASDVPVAPVNIGPRTYSAVYKGAYNSSENSYNDAFAKSFTRTTAEGGRVWAGPRDDGFYVDLGGVFDAANLRPKGVAQDGVAGYNVHAIAIEIPTTSLTKDGKPPGNSASNDTLIGVWASASRRQLDLRLRGGDRILAGPWIQVSRLGLPLINEAVIGLQDKDYWNAVTPRQESYFFPYFLNPVVVRDAEFVGIYKALGVNDVSPFKSGRTDIVAAINLNDIPEKGSHSVPLSATGDVLRVDIATDSGFPNGRSIPGGAKPNQEQADVTDVLLNLILARGMLPDKVRDFVDYNDKDFLSDLPWLPLPWSGYDQGHGKATP